MFILMFGQASGWTWADYKGAPTAGCTGKARQPKYACVQNGSSSETFCVDVIRTTVVHSFVHSNSKNEQ